jgi:predicted thioesterase
MDIESAFKGQLGRICSMEWTVQDDDTARHWGSGSLPVLASPRLMALMEMLCCELVDNSLPECQTTVGAEFTLHHMRPTLPGTTITLRGKLIDIEGRMLQYAIEAWDGDLQLAHATHTRVVIDAQRFMDKLNNPPKEQ